MVLDSSGVTAIIPTFRYQEGRRNGRIRLIYFFKDISQKSHDTFLFTTHWTALSHLATSGWKKLRNVDFIPDNYLPRHTSQIMLLKKKSKIYIERMPRVSTTGGNMNPTGVLLRRKKGGLTIFWLCNQQCVLWPCWNLWSSPRLVNNLVVSNTLDGHLVPHTHSWNLTVESFQDKTHDREWSWSGSLKRFVCIFFKS